MCSAISDCHSEACSLSHIVKQTNSWRQDIAVKTLYLAEDISKALQIIALILLKLEDVNSISLVTLKQLSPY